MSRFLSPLRLEEIEDGSNNGKGTWKLLARLGYESDVLAKAFPDTPDAGLLEMPEGMITDLDSLPRFPLIYRLLNGYARKPAVPHDLLYTLHAWRGNPISRSLADAVLYEALTSP